MTIEDKLIKAFRDSQHSYAFVYFNLFSLLHLGDKAFMDNVVNDFEKLHGGEWFIAFHKQFRQCDVFNERIAFVEQVATQDELFERQNILNKRKEYRDNIETFDSNNEDYFLSGKRLFEINNRMRIYQIKENISGHLDSIMHQTISNDTDNICFSIMRSVLIENKYK